MQNQTKRKHIKKLKKSTITQHPHSTAQHSTHHPPSLSARPPLSPTSTRGPAPPLPPHPPSPSSSPPAPLPPSRTPSDARPRSRPLSGGAAVRPPCPLPLRTAAPRPLRRALLLTSAAPACGKGPHVMWVTCLACVC
eukprot:553899-Rhodomonas_salina.1